MRERTKALGLYPQQPEPIRIERFVEKRFGHVAYEVLPAGVLGFTRFGSNGVEQIVVSRSLLEERQVSSERRANTTLAHEAGHGLLHAHLFALGKPPAALFGFDSGEEMRILCRDDALPSSTRRYDGRWWEFQANQVIGALLIPASLARTCIDEYLVSSGALGRKTLPAGQRGTAAAQMSEVFDVNPVVARIRLEQLYPVSDERQLTL